MKQITLLILCLSFGLSLNAQDRREEIQQKLESRKIAFLSDKLELTPESSQQFWPLYNAFQGEIEEVRRSMKPAHKSSSDMSADQKLDAMLSGENSMLEIKKSYVGKFKEVLGSEKTLLLFKLDREFKERMLKGLEQRRMKMKRDGR